MTALSALSLLSGKEGYLSKSITTEDKDIASVMTPASDTASQPDKPVIMLKRIGSTTYTVAVHFSETSKETMDDKIVRLIKREAVG